MRRNSFLIVAFLVMSCHYFDNKKVYSEELFEEELQTFNWNDVDTYPTFSSCDSLFKKETVKNCFQDVLVKSVNAFLTKQKLIVTEHVSDTISLKIEINKQGVLRMTCISLKPETEKQIPKIDSLLHLSLKQIPKVYPAIKRGQQVTTEFELPVIITIN